MVVLATMASNVYVMYHGTKSELIDSILQYGLMSSVDGMLGPGIYASTDFNKAKKYGDIILKILVYVGKVSEMFLSYCIYAYIYRFNSGKEDHKHTRSLGQVLARQIRHCLGPGEDRSALITIRDD